MTEDEWWFLWTGERNVPRDVVEEVSRGWWRVCTNRQLRYFTVRRDAEFFLDFGIWA